MAHELEIIDGQASMFFHGQAPWHQLGHRFTDPPTTEEAIKFSRLDWKVDLRPLFNELGEKSTHREIYRVDSGKSLGVVGPKYQPLQNSQAFDFFDKFIQSGSLQYETAGVLQDGGKIWIMAKTSGNPVEIAKGDEVLQFLLLSNSHDGSMAIRVGFTPVRVVCANTLAVAHGHKDSKLLRIRHSANANLALKEVQTVIDLSNQVFAATTEQYRTLVRYQVSESDLKNYVGVVFGLKDVSDRKRESRVEGKILELFENSRNNLPSIRGSAWSAYQAVNEYLVYESGRSDENRLNSLWFGPNAEKNRLALDTALEMAKAA